MRVIHLKSIILFVCVFIMTGCASQNEKSELTISAAASLTDAMEELTELFQQEQASVEFIFNFGSSGTLAQQIQHGAPVDVFLSADQAWMDTLEQEGLISSSTRYDFTGNTLVLIAAKDSDAAIHSFTELQAGESGQLAIGDPESVPAGKYTKEALETIGLWEELEPDFVLAKDVRQVLTYVESGNAELGFVYSSDTFISDAVKIVAELIPNGTHRLFIRLQRYQIHKMRN